MATLLAKKSGSQDMAIATTDEHHNTLVADPSIPAFTSNNSFGGSNAFTNTSTGPSAFGSVSPAGFSAPGTISSPTPIASASTSPMQPNATAIAPNADLLKSTGGAMSEGGESLVAHDKDSSDWINKKMRPMMGWIYMLTCTCDFVLFPILWSILQTLSKGAVTQQWQPLTLQGAGLYHIAMGAVLGIAAYGRTKEKVAGVA